MKKVIIAVCYLPFWLHYGIYFILKTIIKYCIFLGAAASIGIIIKTFISFNEASMNVVGVGFGSLITMFGSKDSIMNWIQLLEILGIPIAVIMFVSIEWASTAIDLEEKQADNSLKDCVGSLMNINM